MLKTLFKSSINLLFLVISASIQAKPDLFILKNENSVGDYNQLMGIRRSLSYLLSHEINIHEIAADDFDNITQDLQKLVQTDPKIKIILLSVGNYGLDAFKKIKKSFQDSSLIYVYTSHQLSDTLKQSSNLLDLIALPRHTLTSDFIQHNAHKIIQTTGVAHNLTQEDIDKAYQNDKHKLIPLNQYKKYIGVILGGDAPDPKGNIHHYTISEAEKLALYLADLAKQENAVVLATDGPRTGKYDSKTGNINPTKSRELNSVSQAFLTTLTKNLSADKFGFYGFSQEKSSLNKAIYGAVKQSGGKILIPGESVSTISEAVDNFDKGQIFVYENNAMNETHFDYVNDEHQKGQIEVLNQDLNIIESFEEKKLENNMNKREPAATTIAKAIIKMIQS